MTNGGLKSIVVAVGNVDRKPRNALRKAVEIARRTGARLTLLHVFALPYPLDAAGGYSSREVIEHTKSRCLQRLKKMARPIERLGIEVRCATTWDYPIYEGVVRFVFRAKPDLLIAEAHHHNPLARWFLSNTDWELIRECPCPLWFVKRGALSKRPKVLAAVDPFHAHAKPAKLDERLIGTAREVARQLGGSEFVVHACDVQPELMIVGAPEVVVVPATPERVAARLREAKKALAKLAGDLGVPPTRRIVVADSAERAIPKLAQRTGADVVVMGAVSRRGVRRAVLGNTAERIIEPMRTDLLILKPRGFVSRVSRRMPTLRR